MQICPVSGDDATAAALRLPGEPRSSKGEFIPILSLLYLESSGLSSYIYCRIGKALLLFAVLGIVVVITLEQLLIYRRSSVTFRGVRDSVLGV